MAHETPPHVWQATRRFLGKVRSAMSSHTYSTASLQSQYVDPVHQGLCQVAKNAPSLFRAALSTTNAIPEHDCIQPVLVRVDAQGPATCNVPRLSGGWSEQLPGVMRPSYTRHGLCALRARQRPPTRAGPATHVTLSCACFAGRARCPGYADGATLGIAEATPS